MDKPSTIIIRIQFVKVFDKKPVPVMYINLPEPKESGCYRPIQPWKCAIDVPSKKDAKLPG